MAIPVAVLALSIAGEYGLSELLSSLEGVELDLAVGGDGLHLLADVEEVVLHVLEHVHLRHYELPEGGGLELYDLDCPLGQLVYELVALAV